jgi:anthranilate synthase component I
MTPEQFAQFAAEGYNRIPLIREALADLDTPLSVYLKLANTPYSCLLESVEGGEKWGRYSIIGLPAKTIVRAYGHDIIVTEVGQNVSKKTVADPLDFLADFIAQFRVPKQPELPRRFTGGVIGYFGYDTVRYIEPRLSTVKLTESLDTPDILLMVCDEVIIFDNLKGKLYLIVHAQPSTNNAYFEAQQRLDTLVERLHDHSHELCFMKKPSQTVSKKVSETDFESHFPRDRFEQAVERAKEYIYQGDIMQVVLSQRLSIDYSAPPLNIYRALRSLNPSPYMYYLDLDDFHIVGSSPEILVCLEDNEITVRPIAGTRPRGHDETEDQQLEEELLADPKERAEHLMLIDLGRNDVGRVAQTGTVKLTENMVIERYSHVMHIVSNVIGQIKSDLNALDVLKSAFPAGTLSGAPKIRAMEIINELEPIKRGIYAGAVGYLTWHGDMDTAIAIRTAVIKDKKLYIQVGAGIVADSIPSSEWEETMNKGRAMFKAVAMATEFNEQ